MVTFDQLVAEAVAAPFTGWDFSWLDARSTSEDLPWSFAAEVARYSGTAGAMVDMGTGGGEQLRRDHAEAGPHNRDRVVAAERAGRGATPETARDPCDSLRRCTGQHEQRRCLDGA